METLRYVELVWEGTTTHTTFIRWRVIASSLLIKGDSLVCSYRWLVCGMLNHRIKVCCLYNVRPVADRVLDPLITKPSSPNTM